MKKIIITILVLLGVVCLGSGVVLSFTEEEKSNSTSKTSSSREESPKYYVNKDGIKIYETPPSGTNENSLLNESKQVKKEHCLDSICASDTIISYLTGVYGNVIFDLENKSNQTISAGFLNLEFDTPQGVKVLYFYYSDITAHDSVPITVAYSDIDILDATDYKITYPTEEQLVEYQKTLVS